jgi:hypothetical protein
MAITDTKATAYTMIRKSESYNYWLVKAGDRFHAAIKVDEVDDATGDFGPYMSCGTFSHAEDFETIVDNLAEESRAMMADLFG